MTIKTLAARGASNSDIARLLGVTEGAVRYHVARMQTGAFDGRSRQEPKAAVVAAAIDHWRQMQDDGPINLAVLHAWLVSEYGYSGSLRSIQRYWARTYRAPAVRARRRVETPPGAQAQVDWAHFPAVVVGGIARDLVALHMVLSWSRKAAIVWSETKDMLAWLGCHTACFTRLGGVPATVRIDNEKTAMARGAGVWGTLHPTYRRYATVLHFHVDACPPRSHVPKGRSSAVCAITASPSIPRGRPGRIWPSSSAGPMPGSTRWPTSASARRRGRVWPRPGPARDAI
jgi:transposase